MHEAVDMVQIGDGIFENQGTTVCCHHRSTGARRKTVDVAVFQFEVKKFPNANGKCFWERFIPFPHVLAHLPNERRGIDFTVDGLVGIRLDQGLVPVGLQPPELEEEYRRIMRLRSRNSSRHRRYSSDAGHGREVHADGVVAERKSTGMYHANGSAG